jgi:hypothetical protein
VDYGFKAVRASKRSLDLFVSDNKIGRSILKLVFRSIKLIQGLKHRPQTT